MRKEQIVEVIELRNQVPEAFGRPASEEEIINAESKLGTKRSLFKLPFSPHCGLM